MAGYGEIQKKWLVFTLLFDVLFRFVRIARCQRRVSGFVDFRRPVPENFQCSVSLDIRWFVVVAIQQPKIFVETLRGRMVERLGIAQVPFADHRRPVAHRFQHFGNRHFLIRNPQF